MNKEQIMNILPHRGNMLLLDEAELCGDTSRGKKFITGGEWFLDGHFPENPVVPGVILCEIMAQSACTLLSDRVTPATIPMFTGLDKVRFRSPVRPGDTFETECRLIKSKANFFWASGIGRVNGRVCVTAEFSFVLMPNSDRVNEDV